MPPSEFIFQRIESGLVVKALSMGNTVLNMHYVIRITLHKRSTSADLLCVATS